MNEQFVAAIEAIYEAAPDPSRWPHALDLVGHRFGDNNVNLFWQRDDDSRGVIPSTEFSQDFSVEYARAWWQHDIRAIRGVERAYFVPGDAVTDRDLVTEEEMTSHPFFTQFLARYGMKWLAATWISPDPHIPVALIVNRAASKPAFSDEELAVLSKLGVHAERALRLSMRLLDAELSSAGLAAAFEQFDVGVFFLDSLGRVVFSNAAAQCHIGDGFVVENERLKAAFAPDRNVFKEAVSSTLRGNVMDMTSDPRPILIRRANSARPLSAYILPLRSSYEPALEQFLMRAKAIVLVVDPQPAQPADPAMVRDILGLTLSEARLASLIGTGLSPRKAAERLQISEETARTVLKRIFSKVGVSRQSELSALISKLLLR